LDSSQFRPLGGYRSVVAALAGALDRHSVRLQLQTVVTGIRWRRGSVEIAATCLDQPFSVEAPCAIVTLPLGVLQASSLTDGSRFRAPPLNDDTVSGASPPDDGSAIMMAPGSAGIVRFSPGLDAKRAALEKLVSGAVLKLSLRFRKAFWEELDGGRYEDASFFHSASTAFPTFWTSLPLRSPLLTAWIGGPKAARLSAAKAPEIVRQALESLSVVFGGRAHSEFELEAAYLHNWQTDPFARGAYSYIAVGGESARDELAEPLEDTLFFAGEATATDEAATVTGALQSGARAAREIQQRFGNHEP
jgi:monoamine oxidase